MLNHRNVFVIEPFVFFGLNSRLVTVCQNLSNCINFHGILSMISALPLEKLSLQGGSYACYSVIATKSYFNISSA